MQQQPPSAEREGADAGRDALAKRNAAGSNGPVRRALHLGIAGALERLVQCAGSGRDKADTD